MTDATNPFRPSPQVPAAPGPDESVASAAAPPAPASDHLAPTESAASTGSAASPAPAAAPSGAAELELLDRLEADLAAVETAIATIERISNEGVGGEQAAVEIGAAVSVERFGTVIDPEPVAHTDPLT